MSSKLEKFLKEYKIRHDLILHKKVFTAFDKAATLRIRPKAVGKTLVIKADKDFIIILIPASKNLDKSKFKKVINSQMRKNGLAAVKNIDFTTERWIKKNLKGAKIGAIPPFGNLWKMQTFFDSSLLNEKSIFVSAGDYGASLKIPPEIFKKIPNFNFGRFSKSR